MTNMYDLLPLLFTLSTLYELELHVITHLGPAPQVDDSSLEKEACLTHLCLVLYSMFSASRTFIDDVDKFPLLPSCYRNSTMSCNRKEANKQKPEGRE